MTAKTPAERSAKTAKKRAKAEEEELRHRVRPGTKAMLADLMAWNNLKQISEAIQLLIINAHDRGPVGSSADLSVPRHDFEITESVALEFHEQSMRELRRDPGDEIIAPT